MHNVTFILFPRFQMLAYVLATETLRLANKCAGKSVFTWQTLTATNEPVLASNGVSVAPDTTHWPSTDFPNLIMLCAGYDPLAHLTPRVRAFLSRANRADAMIGGVDTGTVILAELGLLDGYQAVVHFEAEGEFRESWPEIALSDQIYCLDRQRLTAAGGTATGDAVLAWLQQEFGGDFAAATTEAMSHGAMRKGEESQKLLSSIDPVLRRMRSLMRDHLAQPFKLGQICQVLNVSEKQLRTRCQRTFGLTPQAYYLVVRLEQGQFLLRNTHMPITEVALATGFGSLTGFSRAFRNLYGASPRTYRKVVGSDNLIDTTQQRRTSNGIDTVGGWRS